MEDDVSLPWCGLCRGTAIVSDAKPARAEYYRQTAEEIRQVARRSRNPEIREELSDLADRFDRMAAIVEGRQQGYPIGQAPRSISMITK